MFRSPHPLASGLAFLLLSTLTGTLPAARAATFTVSNLNDSGSGSLRAAITATNSSGVANTIDCSSLEGTIQLLSPLPTLQGNLTIRGIGPYRFCVRRDADTTFRLFSVANSAKVTLDGLSITGGGGGLETGGAIENSGALFLLNCLLTSNVARRGGALFSTGPVTISGCTFLSNAAIGGGAISTSGGSLTIRDSTFENNGTYDDGGALVLRQTRTTIANCTFTSNRAGDRGITTDNPGFGGAIFALGAPSASGPGLYVENCTFTGNKAGRGGAIWNFGQLTQLQNTTICDNIAASGAGVWSEGNSTTRTLIGGSILAGNATSPSEVGNDTGWEGSQNTFTSRGYNLVGGGNGISSFAQNGDRTQLSRQQLSLGALSSNGGLTETIMPLSASPAIDAIPSSAFPVKLDQRGKTRPQGQGGDIGAVETDARANSSTFVVNIPTNGSDGACTASKCTLREAIETAILASSTGHRHQPRRSVRGGSRAVI